MSFCFKASGLELGADEAIVILSVEDKTKGYPDVEQFILSSLDKKDRLIVKSRDKKEYYVVTAGSYYLQSLTVYSNIGTMHKKSDTNFEVMHNKKPKDNSGVINILPGTVAYIGEWSVYQPDKKRRFYYKIETTYTTGILIDRLNNHPQLHTFPLAISYDNGNTVGIELKYKEPEPPSQQDATNGVAPLP